MNRSIWIFLVAGAVFLAGGYLATRPGQVLPTAANNDELVVYNVPADRAQDISMAIEQVLQRGDTSLGNSRLSGPGQILVLAPASIHAGIRQSLKTLGADGSKSLRGSEPLALQVWVLRSSAQPASNPALSAVAAQTEALGQELGVAGFELVDSMRLSLVTGNAVMAGLETPRETSLRALATGSGGDYVLQLELTRTAEAPIRLNTRANLKAGQTLVLSSLAGKEPGQSQVVIVRLDPQSP